MGIPVGRPVRRPKGRPMGRPQTSRGAWDVPWDVLPMGIPMGRPTERPLGIDVQRGVSNRQAVYFQTLNYNPVPLKPSHPSAQTLRHHNKLITFKFRAASLHSGTRARPDFALAVPTCINTERLT